MKQIPLPRPPGGSLRPPAGLARPPAGRPRTAAAPTPPAPELIELDSSLLVPEAEATPAPQPPARAAAAVEAYEIPAGLMWQVARQWARVRPGARRLMYATAALLAWLGRHGAAAGVRLGKQAAALARRTGPRFERLARMAVEKVRARFRAVPVEAGRLSTSLRGRPWAVATITGRRLGVLAAGAFALGGAIALPFALAGRKAPAPGPVAVERVARVEPAVAAPEPEAPIAEAETAPAAPPPADADEAGASRGQVARRMAREAFEAGKYKDGVSYFRMALEAQPRAAEDDVLIRYTLVAKEDRAAAVSARRLLNQLAREARADLPAPRRAEAGTTPAARRTAAAPAAARAEAPPVPQPSSKKQLVHAQSSKPFLRWLR